MRVLVFSLVFIAFQSVSFAAIYSCPNGSGGYYYSDIPCAGSAEVLKSNSNESYDDSSEEIVDDGKKDIEKNAPPGVRIVDVIGSIEGYLEKLHLPTNYDDLAINRLKSELFDPDSLKVNDRRVKCSNYECIYSLSRNAKNRYGGYTGYKVTFFTFKKKELKEFIP